LFRELIAAALKYRTQRLAQLPIEIVDTPSQSVSR
jgi:hypothetical protein